MKMKIKSENEKRLEFELKDVDIGFVNSIRRMGIGQLKVFGIDSIVVYENQSHYFDEYLAHRIGQLPITTPTKTEGSEEVIFTFDVQGPGMFNSGQVTSDDKNVKVAFDNMPLFRLKDGHSIRLEGKAILNNARRAGKFQPGLFSYELIKDNDYNFIVESFGNMNARNLMLSTIDLTKNKINELEVALKNI